MFNKLKNKDGQISVIMVVFIMILCYILSGMVDLGTRYWGLKETQSKIDIAGMNALYGTVNLDSLRLETLEIEGSQNGIASDGTGAESVNPDEYEPIVRNAYREELKKVRYGSNKPEIRFTDVNFEFSDFGLGFKENSAKKRPQVVLESVVAYKVDSTTLTDKLSGNINKKVSSSHSNTEFTVTINEKAKDGEVELLIHSITRLVLK